MVQDGLSLKLGNLSARRDWGTRATTSRPSG